MRSSRLLAAAALIAVGLVACGAASAATAATQPPQTGTVSWGNNTFGGAGVGSDDDPVLAPASLALPGGRTISFIVQSASNGAAIASDGTAWAWGDNGGGALGNGTQDNDPHTSPVQISTPTGVTFARIAIGIGFMVAVDTTGGVWSWGINSAGQLGNGTIGPDDVLAPAEVNIPAGVIATDVRTATDAGYALTSTGTIYSWGANDTGQLGNGSPDGDANATPALVDAPTGVSFSSITTRADSAAAIATDGTTYVWGDNSAGNLLLADQSQLFTSTPQPPDDTATGGPFTKFILGGEFSLAVGANGSLYSWGDNDHGQLGDGTTDPDTQLIPTPVQVPAGVTFTQFWPGYQSTYAQASDGTVYAWGLGGEGLLGDGSTDDVLAPTIVPVSADYTLQILSYEVFTVAAKITAVAPQILTTSVPNATVGTPYSQTIVATGTPTLGFAVTAGSLPAGLSLDPASGVISGTPTTATDPDFTVTVTNSAGSASQTYSITVAAATAGGTTAAVATKLAATGQNLSGTAIFLGLLLVAAGAALIVARQQRRRVQNRR